MTTGQTKANSPDLWDLFDPPFCVHTRSPETMMAFLTHARTQRVKVHDMDGYNLGLTIMADKTSDPMASMTFRNALYNIPADIQKELVSYLFKKPSGMEPNQRKRLASTLKAYFQLEV